MKLCKECKHSNWMFNDFWCRHPSAGVDPVSGGPYETRCFAQRGAYAGKCGPEAKLWEPKPTLIQKLKSLFK